MKLSSILQICLLVVVISIFYIIETKFDTELHDAFFIFFIIVSVFAISIILPKELLILFGEWHIIQKKGFEWWRLFWLALGVFTFFRSEFIEPNHPLWHGFEINQLLGILYIINIFLGRHNYYLITGKYIKEMTSSSIFDSVKIKWQEITDIEYQKDEIKIESEKKKMIISFDELDDQKKEYLIDLIKKKTEKTT